MNETHSSTGQTGRVTLRDIAEQTGVAVSTVSRVLNARDRPWADAALSRRIQDTATALGYRPNSHARVLAGGKSETVYLVTRHSLFYMNTTKVITFQHELDKLGRNVVVKDPGLHPESSRVAEHLLADAPETVIFMLNVGIKRLSSICRTMHKHGTHIVFVDYDQLPPLHGRVPADFISVDRTHGSYLAVEHLIAQGHKRIGLLAEQRMAGRLEGYERALRDHGIAFRAIVWMASAAPLAEQEIAAFLKKHPTVSAVFCGSDVLAAGAMRGILRTGRRIPDDIAVVGFDGEPWTPYLPVPLTTVVQPVAALCREAADLLQKRLNVRKRGEPTPPWESIMVKPELVVRASSCVEETSCVMVATKEVDHENVTH